MTFKEWLKYAVKNRSKDSRNLLPVLKLNDGTTLSVQASEWHMCCPEKKLDDGNYEEVEVYTRGEKIKGFGLLDEASPNIYGHIPVEYMEYICKIHGGIDCNM